MGGAMGRGDEMYGLPDLLEAAKCHVPDKPWHALRHTFASHFLMRGGSLYTLKELLGHSSVTTTEIYSHLAADYKADQMALLSFTRPIAGVTDISQKPRKAMVAR